MSNKTPFDKAFSYTGFVVLIFGLIIFVGEILNFKTWVYGWPQATVFCLSAFLLLRPGLPRERSTYTSKEVLEYNLFQILTSIVAIIFFLLSVFLAQTAYNQEYFILSALYWVAAVIIFFICVIAGFLFYFSDVIEDDSSHHQY